MPESIDVMAVVHDAADALSAVPRQLLLSAVIHRDDGIAQLPRGGSLPERRNALRAMPRYSWAIIYPDNLGHMASFYACDAITDALNDALATRYGDDAAQRTCFVIRSQHWLDDLNGTRDASGLRAL